MARWYDPQPVDASLVDQAAFHLSASERLEEEIPARRLDGPVRGTGTLVLTTSRLGFFPNAWDAEPWTVDLDDLAEVRLTASRWASWGAVRGWPDEVIVSDPDGRAVRLALADPTRLLDWFEESDVPLYLHDD